MDKETLVGIVHLQQKHMEAQRQLTESLKSSIDDLKDGQFQVACIHDRDEKAHAQREEKLQIQVGKLLEQLVTQEPTYIRLDST